MTTQARLKELFMYDKATGNFVRKIGRSGPRARAGSVAGCNNGQGYIRIYVDGKPFKAHRLVWLYEFGEWPAHELDHINGNRSDNRIENLRDVLRTQNNKNRPTHKNNAVGIKGVSFNKRSKRWVAQIQYNGSKKGLGYFDTAELASAAYQLAAHQYFGEFARAQ